MLNNKRITKLNNVNHEPGNVLYWMSRDQRLNDNWALITALDKAREYEAECYVVFVLANTFGLATDTHYKFITEGLIELIGKFTKNNVHFIVIQGEPTEKITELIIEKNIKLLISDFDPLKIKRQWKKQILQKINTSFWDVDSHNIVPCCLASEKQEYAAYTIRPKINRLLDEFLSEFPSPEYHRFNQTKEVKVNNSHSLKLLKKLKFNTKQSIIFKSGETVAGRTLSEFITHKLYKYDEFRNNPALDYTSNLSPYLHFGQISAQRIAIEILKAGSDSHSTKSFLEELITRKELSDNFCFYNENYDDFDGFPEWAKNTLNKHRTDKRDFTYPLEILENANTHDELWNTAQKEMLFTGKMSGYMRMYWVKKILEWSDSPESALSNAIYLNDKYSLDGRDPNGYTGIAWSIGGVHDRPWNERQIFGKIRFMSYNSQIRKISLSGYKSKVDNLIQVYGY